MTGESDRTAAANAASDTGDRLERAVPGWLKQRARDRTAWVIDALFGDPTGLAVFLSAVVVLGALWRIDFLLNDSATVANLLVNVADGRLSVVDAPYSLTAGEQPGLVTVDGRLYGRNYGQVYLAVPLVWLLDAVAGLVDLRLALAAGWSLALVALCRTVGGLVDDPRVADAGALLGLVGFGASMLVATRIDWYVTARPVIALGLSTLLLAAVGAVALYRLLAWADGRRAGVAGGLALVLATPIGFWASFPKRHVLSATALLVACYLFAVSRSAAGRRPVLARGGAYAVLGFLASVHAFEAAFALAVLAPLDLLTAPANDRRTLAVVAAVFLVSLTPMLATNAAISGDPLETPRMLPGAGGSLPLDPAAAVDGGGGAGGPTGGGGTGGGGPIGNPGPSDGGSGAGDTDRPFPEFLVPVFGVVDKSYWIASYMLDTTVAGAAAATESDRLVSVFLRSGWIPGIDYANNGFEAVELALLEALPLAGALAWLPVAAVGRLRGGLGVLRTRLRAGLADPVRQTDVLAGGLALTYLVVYLPYLPLWATLTVRYVLLAMPLLLYAVVRLAPVRAAIGRRPRVIAAAYVGTLGIGLAALAGVLATLDPAVGEAVQLHALVGLTAATGLAAVTVTWGRHRRAGPVAVALGVAAGATTVFLILSALAYFTDGHQALDLVRIAADVVEHVG